MKVKKLSKYSSVYYYKGELLEELLSEDAFEEYSSGELKAREFPAGTKILVVYAAGLSECWPPKLKAEALIELDKKIVSKFVTNDDCIVLDDGSGEIVIIGDEPLDITDSKDPSNKYTGRKYGANYIFIHE